MTQRPLIALDLVASVINFLVLLQINIRLNFECQKVLGTDVIIGCALNDQRWTRQIQMRSDTISADSERQEQPNQRGFIWRIPVRSTVVIHARSATFSSK